jgi:type VI secretion system protein
MVVAPLSGCITPPRLCLGSPGVQSIQINSTPQTNGGAPLAVDLVFVTQKTLAQAVAQLSAGDYYANNDRVQLLRDNPDAVEIRYWELPAGYVLPKTRVKPPPCNAKTFLFAGYASNAPHRLETGKAKVVVVDLGPDDMTIRN